MSTQLRNVNHVIAQLRFYGGEDRGVCLNVSHKSSKHGHQVLNLTKEEAALLAAELTLFVQGYEVVDHEGGI